jgi:hypothetical protein
MFLGNRRLHKHICIDSWWCLNVSLRIVTRRGHAVGIMDVVCGPAILIYNVRRLIKRLRKGNQYDWLWVYNGILSRKRITFRLCHQQAEIPVLRPGIWLHVPEMKGRYSYRTQYWCFMTVALTTAATCRQFPPSVLSRVSGFDSRPYQFFWQVGGLERGPLSLVITTEELLEKRSSGSGLENRD